MDDTSRIQSGIERLALVLGMSARDRVAVLNEAVHRLVADDPVQELKKVGRVLGEARQRKDLNERAIARIDRTVVIRKGKTYKSRGRSVVATKEIRKTTRGFQVQIYEGESQRKATRVHRKFFSDSKHNGPFGARAAARKWRDAKERELGINVTRAVVNVQTFDASQRRKDPEVTR